MKYLTLLLSLAALTACEKKSETAAPASSPEISLDRYFPTEMFSAVPSDIHVIRTTAKPGDTITVSGKIMGRAKPFVDGRAAFILGDPKTVTSCDKMDDDHCKTPWDACCDAPEVKRNGTVTVQIVGEDGRVLKQSLKGVHGLKELSEVIVNGTVDKSSTAEALVINASALAVH